MFEKLKERKEEHKSAYISSFSGELNIDCATLVFGCPTILPMHHRLRHLKVWLVEDKKYQIF